MRIYVCGPSDTAAETVDSVLDRLQEQSEVTYLATGSGTGADAISLRWAERKDIESRLFPQDFHIPGVEGYTWAGQVLLAAQPDLVVVFPGHLHTAWMQSAARSAGLPTLLVPKSVA